MRVLRSVLNGRANVAFFSGNYTFRRVEPVVGYALVVEARGIPRATVEPILMTYYSLSGYREPYGSFLARAPGH